MVCVCKDGKRKYKSLGISINPRFWDFEKQRPKRNCPNKEKIENFIADKIKDYSSQIIEYKTEQKEFTTTKLVDKVNSFVVKCTVSELLNNEIERLRSEGRLKYASIYKELKTSLIDLFYLSYLSGGINFVDMAYLTRDNIIDDRLIYTRKKTKTLIKLPLQTRALNIIEKYGSKNIYLFPLFSSFHKSDIQKANRVNKMLHVINRELKQIGKESNIPIDLTTYSARYIFLAIYL